MKKALLTVSFLLVLGSSLLAQPRHFQTLVARKNAAGSAAGGGSISYVGAALNQQGFTNGPIVNYPAVEADDIMLAWFLTTSVHDINGAPPAGWTQIVEHDGDFDGLSAFWKRAGASEPSTETWTSLFLSNENCMSVVTAYRGCLASGSPIDAFDSGTTANVTAIDQGATTTVPNALTVLAIGSNPSGAGITCTWDSATERLGAGTNPSGNNGTDHALFIADEVVASSGAYSLGGDVSEANTWITITVALMPK